MRPIKSIIEPRSPSEVQSSVLVAAATAFVWSLAWSFVGPGALAAEVSYSRDVAPLLSKHCLECHGPDAKQRRAGLRLDTRAGATALLESGGRAIVPGAENRSSMIERISDVGDERMPPPSAGARLSAAEVAVLKQWIEQGANWETHWAFTPPRRANPPPVGNAAWCRNSIDRFVLARLEQSGLAPLDSPHRRLLMRRLYFDVLGVPPTPRQVAKFVGDRRPNAWEDLVDRVLASPLYGQRWGRHWLDVARYGDSNGGDENHAYPNAWRYRDYVVAAFNEDLPFNEFVREQIAGDLLNSTNDSRAGERVTATGFLALGTKILAERDKVKMRADLVDEQIDTLGKSFLALTLGCARCHDHKFDPIPSTDYYALAGILHSTNLTDTDVPSPIDQRRREEFDARLAQLLDEQNRLRKQLEVSGRALVDREAEKFDRGNVSVNTSTWGKGIGIISDPGAQDNFAEYDVELKAGKYLVQLRYAALNVRAGRISINGKVVRDPAISLATGGWMPEHQQWCSEGVHEFADGKNVLRIESKPLMSHIDRVRLIPYEQRGELAKTLTRLEFLADDIAAHRKTQPKAVQVMSATEGTVKNVRVHIRGSHLDLGAEVARGFPRAVSAGRTASGAASVASKQSGRLELAGWLTDLEAGAGGQTARVIANRVWHWHFGRGLVATPNDFGRQGERPTHPQLLDWLATTLVAHDWSLKALHREILNSATYRQQATRVPHPLYAGVPRRRLDAEVIRDSLLFHAGRLDFALVGDPLVVKSQDPSPADLQKNEAVYRDSRRRSVYLPVVRSNVVRFLTIFDFPNAATPVGRRNTTTVPTQALLLMNDPFVMTQAEHLAGRLLRASSQSAAKERADWLFERLFSRRATAGEQAVVSEFLAAYRETTEDADSRELATWSGLCQILLSSSEFVYVE
ncbi:MAG: DUF1549 domain-containing protein [Pirellulaceae bacterium]|jgi:hypothetical protein|nr:DUF1549 domain-containing protein [Pirellulaceae bacterium]MDP7017687.1 DUF1549 domain-containing protein [Pirellulaceae bacterium]